MARQMSINAITRPKLRPLSALAAAALVVMPLHASLLAQDSEEDTANTPASLDAPSPDESATAEELGTGEASYYGSAFAGNRTASGERFDPTDLTAAHPSLPFGSRVQVTSLRTGKSVIVRINDRGPFHGGRVIDLSEAAAREIGIAKLGHARVRLSLLSE